LWQVYLACCAGARTILVTGATGATGQIIYKQLQATKGVTVRGLVTNLTEAKAILGCNKCDAAEGIFLGDVTDVKTLLAPCAGADSIAIAVGVGESSSVDTMKAVEWHGVQNQVSALVSANSAIARSSLFVSLISSMGTTDPNPAPYEGGKVNVL
jgi:uncharacterized protein YbjT (DUF2867 family)